jgi:membrane dipeptidase
MLIFDAHLDLSMNATEWNRDLRMPIQQIRAMEQGLTDKPDRGQNTVTFGELRKGNVGIVVGTQIARYASANHPMPGWNSPEQAWAHTQAQLAWYKTMEKQGFLRPIRNAVELEAHLNQWNASNDHSNQPIGYILSLEGADSIVDVSYLETAYNYGLRALGPAHYGPGRYAQGTNATGGLGTAGRALLAEMQRLNIILDATHLCDDSFAEAMDVFSGPVWASHSLCRAIVNHNRQFSDQQLRTLISRGAVIGAAFDAWMIVPNWQRGQSTPQTMNCYLSTIVNHIDHICQLAGNTLHLGLGTDLDGGFGLEQSPADIDTIADLQKIPELLQKRGYTNQDIENICHKNWLNFLLKAWK